MKLQFTYSNVYLKMGHNRLMLGVFRAKSHAAATNRRAHCFNDTTHLGVVQMCGNVHVCFYPNKIARCFLSHSTAHFRSDK